MALEDVYVPYGQYWSTPFCRWQGSLSGEHSIRLAGKVASGFIGDRQLPPKAFDSIVLGFTVPQKQSFYGAPWLAGMIGCPGITGPNVSQACATSVQSLSIAATSIECGMKDSVLVVNCDRVSNSPRIDWPTGEGGGTTPEQENVVKDSFSHDPYGGTAMIDCAENVAAEAGISRQEQEEMSLIRYSQYMDALAGDRAFQKRFMVPAEAVLGDRRLVVEKDEGVTRTTAEGLAGLRTVLREGSVTFGTQTHPADGNAGMVVCRREIERQISRDRKITIRLLGFGEARVRKAFMPMAVVPAARKALKAAGVRLGDCKVIKTHNPFALNDVWFCRQMELAPERVNGYGSSLVYGHPQGPTGLRGIIEMVEQLVLEGGGVGLFSGCAAGDSAMGLCLAVGFE